MTKNTSKNITQLFAALTAQEAVEAEQNVDAYLTVVLGIYIRIKADPTALAELRNDLADIDRSS